MDAEAPPGAPAAAPERAPAATIADVAALAKVSPATVSRVFSRPALVSAKTRDAVMDAARAADYRPNGVARALRRRRSGAILVLVPDLGNPFYPRIVHAIEREAHGRGYTILMGNTAARADYELSYLDLLRDGRADGLLLLTGRLPPGLQTGEGRTLAPTVLVAEHLAGSGLATVRIDNEAAAVLAMDHLLALGHRRIAHVAGPMRRVLSVDRLAGYRAALAAAGIAPDPALIAPGEFSFEGGRGAGAALLALVSPPTAIFCANDESAVGVLAAARDAGLDVPADLSVCGFDDIALAEMVDPPLTTIRQPREAIGREALRLLIEALDGRGAGAPEVRLPVELVVRGSTAPPALTRKG